MEACDLRGIHEDILQGDVLYLTLSSLAQSPFVVSKSEVYLRAVLI